MDSRRHRCTAALAASAALLAAGCSSDPASVDGEGESACPAAIVYEGTTYLGHGELLRDPVTTGHEVSAVISGCDDSGGQDPAPRDEPVQVAELAEVPLDTAFLWGRSVFVRAGQDLPATAEAWFEVPRCDSRDEFRILADWLGVTTPRKPRFDGDLRPPYRLEVHVVEGPAEYVGATVELHVDAATQPALSPEDVEESLWQGGTVLAQVRCEEERFQATSVRVPPQE